MTPIEALARKKILILDGAMGTLIQTYGLTERDFHSPALGNADWKSGIAPTAIPLKGNNDVLNLTRPDIVADIHRCYLHAGADIIETNTFSAQRISQADYQLEELSREMAYRGACIAREAADAFSTPDRPRFVAGSMGPTNKTASISPDVENPAFRDVSYDQLYEAYHEQAEALAEGGVDAFLIETIFDTLNAKAAIAAASHVNEARKTQLPIMLSITIADKAGRLLSGQTLDAFLATISSYDIFSVGLNCSFGADEMLPYLKQLAQHSPYFISAYPNAGLPNEMGEYSQQADEMAELVKPYVEEGLVNIVGGCCGTTDAFIRFFAQMAEGKTPHVPLPHSEELQLAGLEPLRLTPEIPFVNVGERCNVAGSRKFLRLINEKNYDEALSIARKQVDDGALVLDINMDDGLLDAAHEMQTFLNLIVSDPDISRVPIMIDSSDWNVIMTGLKCMQGKCIVNSISLKEGEDVFKAHARDVRQIGAAVVVMCFDEQGQATTYERRIAIAERSYRILTEEIGMRPQDIIFDPNILAIATGMEEHDAYARDFIRAAAWIREHLPGAHVSGGVSNLSFSFRGNNYIREAMHAVFLYHAINAGMDFGIVNPATKVTYSDIPQEELDILEDVVLNRRSHAADDLIKLSQDILAKKEEKGPAAESEKETKDLSVEERLSLALRKGNGEHLEADLMEAMQKYGKAVDIIEGPLMSAMDEVGRLFGEGKMFLPQVVKTARTMKQAVAILQPYLNASAVSNNSSQARKIVMATVKGDVHDIGKNIVSVILACNGYEVIDLGVMVPPEKIVETVKATHADAVGLSGLITPSLSEMVNVATEMEKAGLRVPILIGGATTSALHAALKIAPQYTGIVVWMKDAAQNVIAANRLCNPKERSTYMQQIREEQEEMRRSYRQKHEELLSIEEARRNKLDLFN